MSAPSPDIHAALDRFVDGELPAEEAERFRQHLAACPRCQAGLHERVQMEGLSQDALAAAKERPEPAGATVIRPARWRVRVTAAVGVALAASLAVVVVRRGGGGGEEDPSLWLAGGAERRLEARLSTPGADRHRPYQVSRGPQALPPPPLESIARLEKENELVAAGDAYLARGQPEVARGYLERALDTPGAYASRAALALALGEPGRAYDLASSALAKQPGLSPARWNRALALRALGLPLAAAADFDAVAAAGEPGWAEEARQLAAPLRVEMERRRAARAAAVARCREAVEGKAPFPVDLAEGFPHLVRRCFGDALRGAGTARAVKALAPAAEALDRRWNGDHLRRAVEAVERRLQGREPLAREYARLAAGGGGPEDAASLADRARRQGQPDLELGALDLLPVERLDLERFRALAEASGDPWLTTLLAEKAAAADLGGGRPERALEELWGALADCAVLDQGYHCLGLERLALSAYLMKDSAWDIATMGDALSMGQRALERARRESDLEAEAGLLRQLSEVAGHDGDEALSRAYGEEAALRAGGPGPRP